MNSSSVTVGTNDASQLRVGVVGVLAGKSTRLTDATKEQNDGHDDEANDDELASSRVAHTVVSPGALAVAHVLLDLVSSKLVVDEAAKSDAVTEELERRDGVAEDHHGCNDEEDILEYTAEGHNEAGGSADLWIKC